MSWFQLDPQSIADRARAASVTGPTLAASLVRGALGFTMVSIAGFVPWAVFGRRLHKGIGEAGMYTVCAIVFIGLTGPALHRLIIGPGSLPRFYKLFSIAFTAYSVAWILAWMKLRGNPGSLVGLFAGTVIMGCIFAAAFDAWGSLGAIVAALFLLNTAGYFAGMPLEKMLMDHSPVVAKLQWGVFYGLGFGAGLGLAFYFCQERARALLGQ